MGSVEHITDIFMDSKDKMDYIMLKLFELDKNLLKWDNSMDSEDGTSTGSILDPPLARWLDRPKTNRLKAKLYSRFGNMANNLSRDDLDNNKHAPITDIAPMVWHSNKRVHGMGRGWGRTINKEVVENSIVGRGANCIREDMEGYSRYVMYGYVFFFDNMHIIFLFLIFYDQIIISLSINHDVSF